ncbi:SDH1, partial [Symbiodinium pilosum]
MTIYFEVALISGKRARLSAELDTSVDKLRKKAQKLLCAGRGCLLSSSGGILGGGMSVSQAGLQKGDI